MKAFQRIQPNEFDLDHFDSIQQFPECGGIGIFQGTVRNHHQGRGVQALKYTAYTPVAEKMIRQIEQEITEKYGVSYVRVIHRIGYLDVGGTAILAVAYAPHRREAFAACEEAVERVKHEVPIWKEEFYTDGSSQFVEGCCIRKDHDHHHSEPHIGHHQHDHQH
ncbi:molybdenum cofactor biosynthesis protein MoaE [Acinetobacter ihumii]|uniref:molybdenum cofactor biosynthesis protein MoaE n=1 Tax=Acinetobacter ihumii TaxID=2483802 RepID=UPI0010312D64|nr:molybdenum cofactor biosynthesis protein MoaE [Acinetobacter ihumii]